MLKVNLIDKQQSRQKPYRQYSPTALQTAYSKIINKDMTIYRASKVYGIPKSTLLDRISGRISAETIKSGPAPLLSLEEEARLVDHVKLMAAYGYGYTRSEVVNLASDYCVSVGKRDKDHPLTFNWYHEFLGRWPEIKAVKARGLALSRAKAASPDNISKYFEELENTITKYNLADKPHCIYNIDEKGVNFQHTPPKVVAAAGSKPPGVTSERSATVTIIGAGNAMGTQIPPYIIFPGARMREELISECTAGTGGTVTSSGWSNTEVFQKYLEEHFLKYVQGLADNQPILLIYDGHKSHVALSIIDWAKKHNIILLILPAHCSHILQPLDVSCFGPLSRILNNMSHKHMRENHVQINRYNIGKLASQSYVKGLSIDNLKSGFQKTGIYPLNKDCVSEQTTMPSLMYNSTDGGTAHADTSPTIDRLDNTDGGTDHADNSLIIDRPDNTDRGTDHSDGSLTIDRPDIITDNDEDSAWDFLDKDIYTINNALDKVPSTDIQQDNDSNTDGQTNVTDNIEHNKITDDQRRDEQILSKAKNFFVNHEKRIVPVFKTKKRKLLSYITSGNCITEDKIVSKITKHVESQSSKNIKKSKGKELSKKGKIVKTVKEVKKVKPIRGKKQMQNDIECVAKPGPSGLSKIVISDSEDEAESETDPKDLCCVCNKFCPDELKNCISVVFTQWGQCMFENCNHWTHLRFCCNVKVLRRHSVFYCPCHGKPCLQYEE